MTLQRLKRYCFALDLSEDIEKIEVYKAYHKKVWPEINLGLRRAGIQHAEIYNTANRLFMILEVDETFSLERKAKMDAANPNVQQWEELMWKYQQALPYGQEGSKWILMDKIYDLDEQ